MQKVMKYQTTLTTALTELWQTTLTELYLIYVKYLTNIKGETLIYSYKLFKH